LITRKKLKKLLNYKKKKQVRQPSTKVCGLISGEGLTSARPSDPKTPKGVVLPPKSTTPMLEGEGTADWIDEYTMVAEVFTRGREKISAKENFIKACRLATFI